MRCNEGKFRYATEMEAKANAKAQREKGRENKKVRNRLGAYLCPFCRWWHVGHDRLKGQK